MPSKIVLSIENKEPTMANSISHPKTNYIQLDFFGKPVVSSTTKVLVQSHTKKNGAIAVKSHNRIIKRKKKKFVSNKIKQMKETTSINNKFFPVLIECKESVALAHSLHIQELKELISNS